MITSSNNPLTNLIASNLDQKISTKLKGQVPGSEQVQKMDLKKQGFLTKKGSGDGGFFKVENWSRRFFVLLVS